MRRRCSFCLHSYLQPCQCILGAAALTLRRLFRIDPDDAHSLPGSGYPSIPNLSKLHVIIDMSGIEETTSSLRRINREIYYTSVNLLSFDLTVKGRRVFEEILSPMIFSTAGEDSSEREILLHSKIFSTCDELVLKQDGHFNAR